MPLHALWTAALVAALTSQKASDRFACAVWLEHAPRTSLAKITLRKFRSRHSVGCTECRERNFLDVIVAREVRAVCSGFTITPLASTPSARWCQDFFDVRFTCASTDTVPDA